MRRYKKPHELQEMIEEDGKPRIECPSCLGYGEHTYCVNPDNGYLDTQAHNLREETFVCDKCQGKGWIFTNTEEV